MPALPMASVMFYSADSRYDILSSYLAAGESKKSRTMALNSSGRSM
jgi:hypothetical protein